MYRNQRKIVITESEKRNIQKMYGISEKKDFVFDFVLTENNKYLIIMDEVFVEGGDGQSIGTIWENTHIFNELIKESLTNLGDTITESIHNEVNNILENTVWTKEMVTEWVINGGVLSEGVWDTIKSGASTAWEGIKSGAKAVGSGIMKGLEWVFKNGVLPFLRWVRRGLYTGIGIVIDVVISILAVKSNVIIWLIICALDIYEIVTGDFDPKDPERKESPYLFLIGDLLSAALTAGVGKVFSKSIPMIKKVGVRKAAPTMVKMLESLANKIPSLKSSIKSAANTLGKKFKGDSVISVILRSIDGILTKISTFLNKLLSREGAKAVATGVAVAAVVKGAEAYTGVKTRKGGGGLGTTVKTEPDVNRDINPDIVADAEKMGIFK
jgi:hypothetical protein